MATSDTDRSIAERQANQGRPDVAGGRAARGSVRLVLPSDADLEQRPVVEAAGALRIDVAFHLTVRMGARPHWLPSTAFERVDGLMDAQAVCASDGAPFDPHSLLMRHATQWRDVSNDGPEAQVQRFVDAYAEPIDERAASAAQSERLFADRPPDGGRQRLSGDEMRAGAIEALSRNTSGPGARLRPARGYHGGVQPSPFLRKPREGAEALEENLGRLADWISRAPVDPLLAAAITYAWLVRLHPVRYANRRLATLAFDRLFRGEPAASAARLGLGRALAARRREEARLIDLATGRGAWTAYLRWFLVTAHHATRASMKRSRRYELAAAALLARLRDEDGRRLLGRRRVRPERLAAAAAASPYLGATQLSQHGLAECATAAKYLAALVRLGVAWPHRHGRYRLVRVVSLVDALAPPPPPGHARQGLDRLAATARTLRVCAADDL